MQNARNQSGKAMLMSFNKRGLGIVDRISFSSKLNCCMNCNVQHTSSLLPFFRAHLLTALLHLIVTVMVVAILIWMLGGFRRFKLFLFVMTLESQRIRKCNLKFWTMIIFSVQLFECYHTIRCFGLFVVTIIMQFFIKLLCFASILVFV